MKLRQRAEAVSSQARLPTDCPADPIDKFSFSRNVVSIEKKSNHEEKNNESKFCETERLAALPLCRCKNQTLRSRC